MTRFSGLSADIVVDLENGIWVNHHPSLGAIASPFVVYWTATSTGL
jgi:hypothetical protein